MAHCDRNFCVLAISTVRKLNAVYVVLLAGLLVRLLTLLAVLYLGPYNVLAGSDSLSFYEDALYVAQSADYFPFEIGWKPYVNAIGFLMFQFGESISFMFLLSVAAWLCSAVLIDKSLASLQVKNSSRTIAAITMAFFPSILLTTSIPMREAFQLLGISIASYSVVKIIDEKNFSYLFAMISGILLSSILHVSLLASSSIFVILLFLGYNLAYGKLSISQLTASVAAIFAIAVLIIGFVQPIYQGDAESVFGIVESFRDNSSSLDARAQYTVQNDSGVAGVGGIIGLSLGFIQYMIEPLPWRISALGDIVVMFENILRLALIAIAIKRLRTASYRQFALSLTLLMMFFAVEFIWSMGTINWGTAARHHVPSFPLLLIACFALSRERGHTESSRNMRFQRI